MWDLLDLIARVIGYGAMAYGAIWALNQYFLSERATKDYLDDRDRRIARELELAKSDPEAYRQYRLKRDLEEWEKIRKLD